MTTLLAFVVTLALLIVVHEYGHYRVAKACGVKVLRFSLGFGRVLWRHQSSPDATEFTICAIPLGGYVRMLDDREDKVLPEEREQAFNNRPLRQRVAVTAAGPIANLLLAILLFAAALWVGIDLPKALLGTPLAGSIAERAGVQQGDLVQATSADGEHWTQVLSLRDLDSAAAEAMAEGHKLYLDVAGRGSRKLILDTDGYAGREYSAELQRQVGLTSYGEPVIGVVMPGDAGDHAGLLQGDRLLEIDGIAVADGAGARERIRAALDGAQGRLMHWRIERAGQAMDIAVQPGVVDEAGRKIGHLGIAFAAPAMTHVQYGFFDGIIQGAQRTWETASLSVRMFGRMIIGQASLKNLSGPVAMADYAGQSARMGLPVFLNFLAFVSVSLGVFNLLPLPMLDGGHLMYYLFEGLTGRPLSEWWQQQLQRAGALVLMLMMVLALSNDVVARLPGLH